MKKLLLFCLFITALNITAQDWTWMKGSDTITDVGKYGTIGVSSPTNNPGSRHGSATWVDNSGNLWLFGGEGITTNTVLCWLNDMWKFDVSSNEWTWIRGTNLPNQLGLYGTQGVSSPTNEPGAREFMTTWTDASGNFWMFGGYGFASAGSDAYLSDLWKYNPVSNEWTWMKGSNITNQPGVYGTIGVSAPGNLPGARNGPCSWADASGNLWLFGGFGYPAITTGGNLNDLWRYNITSNEWTWIHGTSMANQFGNYGTKSVASPTNNPGGREFPVTWIDAAGDLWMFGGGGYPASGSAGHLNDLWKYNPSANSWMWVSGTNMVNQNGVFGSPNVPSVTNIPGGKFAAASWMDVTGNLWLFGGTGYSDIMGPGRLNDLFKYNPVTNEWSWEHGFNSVNQNGIYGSITVPAPANTPGSRYYNTWWKQTGNNFWLLGGFGYSASDPNMGNMNDLWKFKPSCGPSATTASSLLTTCNGNSVTISASAPGSVTWYSSLTSTTAIGTGTNYTTPGLTALSSQSVYTFYAGTSPCPDRTPISITVNITPTVTIFTDNSLICAGTTITITANGANTYTWNTSATGQVLSITPSVTTSYTVTGTDTNGCVGIGTLTQSVSACTSVMSNIVETRTVRLYPNPNNGIFYLSPTLKEGEFVLYNTLGQEVFKKELKGEIYMSVNIAKGIYYYFIEEKGLKVGNGKMVVE